MIIGLTGSIAMGKTTTADMFKKLGNPVFNADEAVHSLYKKGGKAAKEIAKILPDVIVDGAVDRKMLADTIAKDKLVLPRIEKIVHPMVHVLEQQFISKHMTAGTRLIILDIPLLFEAGRQSDVDVVVVVSTSSDIQKKRALARLGMTESKLKIILGRQLPDKEKRARADFIIDTGISLENTLEQVKKLVQKLSLSDEKRRSQ